MTRARALRAVACAVVAAATLVAPAAAGAPVVGARAYVLETSLDGTTLAARSPMEQRAIASITKLMTALVARRHTRLDEVVVVPAAATLVGESSIGLRPGQRVTVRDLLVGTLIPSANDAATALALHAAHGSLPRFVRWMNLEARRLGLAETHFENPHGLDQPGHVSSARDVATLLGVALHDPVIRRYARSTRARLSSGRVVESTDNLIGSFAGFVGGKTGHTSDAGWSQVAAVRRHGVTITAAVLGSATEAARDADLAALLRYGLTTFRPSVLVDPARVDVAVEVGWGLEPVRLTARRVVGPAPTGRPLVERLVVPVVAPLPIRRGDRLGSLVVLDGSRVVARSPLLATRTVPIPTRWEKARYLAGRTTHHLFGWIA